jgi:hypothetical protein
VKSATHLVFLSHLLRHSLPIMFLNLAEAIENWLLASEVQLASGPHKGGVAGWLTTSAQTPAFVYPEITGYFLTWLAFGHARQSNDHHNRAAKAHCALQWLCRQIQSQQKLPTRVHLLPPREDWRNQACFAFDWAMVIRGAAAARELLDCPEIDGLISSGLQFLKNCCTPDHELQPFTLTDQGGSVVLPERWSSRPGPYLLKVAAALRLACDDSLEGVLEESCQRLISRWGSSPAPNPATRELHSLLYSVEGLLLLGVRQPGRCYWKLAAERFEQLLESNLQNARWPPAHENSFEARSDVLGQALRIGSILMSHGFLRGDAWKDQLSRVAMELQGFVSSDGAVVFDKRKELDRPHWNAWSAMFASQAFYFWETCLAGKIVEPKLIRLLV